MISHQPTPDVQRGENARAETSEASTSVAAPSPAATSPAVLELPVICQGCGKEKIRDGVWTQFHTHKKTGIISHGLCPDCTSINRVSSLAAVIDNLAITHRDTLATLRALLRLQAERGYPQLAEYTNAAQSLYTSAVDFQHALQSVILTLTLAQATNA